DTLLLIHSLWRDVTYYLVFSFRMRRPPSSTLFPYTTLFRSYRLDHERDRRRLVFRMQHAGGLEEQVVPRHRVIDARAGQDEAIVTAERRDHDGGGHDLQSRLTQDGVERGGADPVLRRAGDCGCGQDVQVGDVREHVQDGHDQHARAHSDREVALGVLELAS